MLVEEGDALRAVAWYIDLNPVRAGMLKNPEDYRWSGFGEAMAGVESSRKRIATLMQDWAGGGGTLEHGLAAYRLQLYVAGEAVPFDENGENGRLGFTRDQIKEVEKTQGELSLKHALGRRIRHFTEGVVLGSMAFVSRQIHRHQRRYGSNRGPRMSEIRSLAGRNLFALGASS